MMMTLWRHAVVRVDGHVCLHRQNQQLHVLGHSPWPLAPQVKVLLELVLGAADHLKPAPAKGPAVEPPQAREPPLALELQHPPSLKTSVETPPAPGQALEGHCHCQLHDDPGGRPPAR